MLLALAPSAHADTWTRAETRHFSVYSNIEPAETRRRLIRGLEVLKSKRDQNPPRKHGNIPL